MPSTLAAISVLLVHLPARTPSTLMAVSEISVNAATARTPPGPSGMNARSRYNTKIIDTAARLPPLMMKSSATP